MDTANQHHAQHEHRPVGLVGELIRLGVEWLSRRPAKNPSVSRKKNASEAFCQLLESVFLPRELRRFVSLLPEVEGLDSRLPGEELPLTDLAFEVVRLLERESLIHVALDRLDEVRPRSRTAIAEVRCLYRP